MAFQLPTDLINQVQIAARNAAGLSTYNPDDPSLPSLPSFDASVFGLDPSAPEHLRCKNCKGKLLRGEDSVICIYCGKQINKDLPPHPISFTSTFGYQWLLRSLDLDQSETVGPSTVEPGSSRGHTTAYQEKSLRHLLDLQITWPDELEIPEISVPHKISEESSSSLNLSGADLDNAYSGSKRNLDTDASAQPVIEQQLKGVESKGSISGFRSVQENFTSFSDAHSADSAAKSFEDNQGGSLSGWAADFQSADKEESSNSYDSFVTPNIDLSSHIDSVFGAGIDENRRKLPDDLQPAQSASHDWMPDDLWKNLDSNVSHQALPFSLTAETTNAVSPDNYKNTASEGVDWFEDDQWQKNITSEPGNKIIDNPDESFDDWNDFASSSNAVNLSGGEPSSKVIDKPDESFDDWNDFASSGNTANLAGGEPSNKVIDKPDDASDDWNDFASSSVSRDVPSNKITDRPDDSFNGWNDLAGSSNDVNLSGNEPSSKTIDKFDDSFDDWNDFASTSNYLDLSGNAGSNNNRQKAVSREQTSEKNLFSSTANTQDNEFGSFSQPNLFSGLPGGYDGDAMTNNIDKEVYASERKNNEQSDVKDLSEDTAGPSSVESEPIRGHITPNQETSSHHLYDLQATWPDELKMPDTSVPPETSEQSSSSFNLSGADLDSVFSVPKTNVHSESSTQPITEKQLDSVENKGSISGFGSAQDDFPLFSNDHSADLAVKSFKDSRGDSFSGWPADFQSANKDESSKSYDPFAASNIDLSSHIDSVFGARKDENRGRLEDNLQHTQYVSDDWMQGDLWKNVGSDVSQHSVPFGVTAEATDGISQNNAQNPASQGVDWFLDNQWHKDITSEPSNKIIDNHDDSSDDWTDFASSSIVVNHSGDGPSNKIIGKTEDSFDDWNDFASSSNAVNPPGDIHSNKISDKPDNSFDDWNDFARSNNAVKLSGYEPSNKVLDKHNDSSDDWNDFASSSNAINLSEDKFSNKIIDQPDDSFDDWNDFASSSIAPNLSGDQPGSKIIDKPDDSSDDWNDFASSSNAVNLSGDEPSSKIIDKPDDWNDFTSSSIAVNLSGDEPSGKINDKPNDSLDAWDDFPGTSSGADLSRNA